MKNKYAIRKNNGQWWTGLCWGVEQAREEYEIRDLPRNLMERSARDGDYCELITDGVPADYCYCDMDAIAGDDIVARVREVT